MVDSVTGKPVAGALVTLRRESAPQQAARGAKSDAFDTALRRDGETLDATMSDGDGRFTLAWRPWRSGHLRVEAEGYTPLALPLGAPVPPDPVPLLRAGMLTVRILGEEAPVAGALVRLVASLADRTLGEPDGRLARHRIVLEAQSDGQGRASFEGAPAGRSIELTVGHGDWTLGTLTVAPLAPSEERHVLWTLPATSTLEGTLIDQRGEPVGRQELWLLPTAGDDERYLTCGDLLQTTRRETTDDSGRFRFERVLPGRWLLGPRPSRPSEVGSGNDPAPWASLLALGDEGPWSVELERPVGLVVEGTLRTDSGRIATAVVLVGCEGGGLRALFEGSFRLGPFADRAHELEAFSLVSELASERVSVRPAPLGSRKPVELVLRRAQADPAGAVVTGSVVDGATGAPLEARVTAVEASHADAHLVVVDLDDAHERFWDPSTGGLLGTGIDLTQRPTAETDGLGGFRLEGLEPGTHVLFVRAAHACAAQRIVVPSAGALVRDVLIEIPPPAKLVLLDRDEPKARGTAAIRIEATFLVGQPWGAGKPLLVPPGRWTAVVSCEERRSFHRLDARPGEEVALDLSGR